MKSLICSAVKYKVCWRFPAIQLALHCAELTSTWFSGSNNDDDDDNVNNYNNDNKENK